MAKRNLFLGTASGKIGDIVVYRAGGTQRSRVRVTPKDAKTSKQMAQRSKIGGVVVHYRAGLGLFRDSFESRRSNQSTYNAFAEEALPNAPYMVKEAVEAGLAIPMHFPVSRGSVPNPFDYETVSDGNFAAVTAIPETTAPTTYAALADSLIDARPCCFKNGTVIVGVKFVYNNVQGFTGKGYKPVMVVDTIKLDNSNTSSIPASAVLKPIVVDGHLALGMAIDDDATEGYAVVVVNTDADGIHVTSADIYLNENAQDAYSAAITSAARQAAEESWGASGGSCVL